MEKQHTPWPWEASPSPGLIKDTHDWHVYAPNAPVGKKLPAIVDTRENAMLIAAAPDLLAACIAALDFAKYADKANFDGGCPDIVQALKDAIKKAKGRK